MKLVAEGRWGEMACLQDGHVDGVPIHQAIDTYRLVDPEGELVAVARATGVELGA
ncbi:MAG: hypothetical protein HN348_05740 [Proteobacteria bacterium]|nr:hypothetical protein [Pseudomonadota bacterium]